MPDPEKPGSKCLLKRFCSKVNKDHLILLVLAMIHGINNYIWLMKDKMIQQWDSAQYLTFSFQYHELFGNPTSNFIVDFFAINRWRPPLRLILASPFYQLFGVSPDVAVMTNLIFMVILLFSVYGIGKYLFSRQVGLLAAFTVSFFPIIHGLSRSFLPDFALTAMVTLSIYCLLKTDYFTNKKYSLLFGLSLGLGLMIRDTFLIFIIGPLLYIMYKSNILKIRALLKTFYENWQALMLVIISSASIGAYFYFVFAEVLLPEESRLDAGVSAIIIICMILAFLIIWFSWSTTLNAYSDSSLKSIMLKVALSMLPFLILSAVFIMPEVRAVFIFALFPVAALIFIIINILLLRNDYLTMRKKSKNSEFQRHPWLNYNRSIIIGLIVAGWFYLPMAHRILPNLILNPTYVKPHEGHMNIWSWESISYYYISLLNQQIYLFAFILIACLLIFIVRYGRPALNKLRETKPLKWPGTLIFHDWKSKLILLIWIAIPYIFFSLSHTKNSRYISPYLPAIAIGMAAALLSFPKRWQKGAVVLVVLSLGGFQMVACSYGIDYLPDQIVVDTPLGELMLFGQEPLGRHQYIIHPQDGDWYIDDALNFIYDDYSEQLKLNSSRKVSTIQVGTITDGWVNVYVFKYKVLEVDLPITIRSTALYEPEADKNSSHHSFYTDFDSIDYIIELENYTIRPKFLPPVEFFHEVENYELFERINSYQLPDKSTLVVFRRI